MQARQIDNSTPLVSLTAGEFAQVLREALKASPPKPSPQQATGKNYVYGIAGIADLLGVSKVTAQRYKDTFLQPAVMQRGRKLITDADKAMKLFAQFEKGGQK